MDSVKTRQLVPVFVGADDGQDVRNLVYVKDAKGTLRSLAELQSLYQTETSDLIPGVATNNIVEASDERGPTITSNTVSPYRICCVYQAGVKICFIC